MTARCVECGTPLDEVPLVECPAHRAWDDMQKAETRTPPELLSREEERDLLHAAEQLWADLQHNELGGFSGINRPFYILNEFRRVIEKYGHRDVGMTWSKDELDGLPS